MNIRQGDLLFKQVNESVEGKEIKKLPIAEGEFTGHFHTLVAEAGSSIVGNKTKFTVKGRAKLIHPEHDSIPFESGTYIVSFEREFDYIGNEIARVQD